MKRRLLLSLFGIGLAVSLALLILVRNTPPRAIGLVGGRLRPCPDSPNCVSSQSSRPSHHVEPLVFEGDPQRAFASLMDFLTAERGVSLEERTPTYAHAVFRTRILRFRDDVEFLLDPDARVIHVRSASRIGYSDLGKNRARIEDIRRRWNPHPPAHAPEPSAG